MTRIALALAALISITTLTTPASAGCAPRNGTIFCELTRSNTELGTKRAFKNLGNNGAGPTFRVTLEWMEEEPAEPGITPTATWCSLVVTYTADPTQNINQISIAHTSTWTLTGDGTSRLLTAGREALLIHLAGVWLAPPGRAPTACSAVLEATYTRNATRLVRD